MENYKKKIKKEFTISFSFRVRNALLSKQT